MSDLIDVDGLRAALEHACPESEIETWDMPGGPKVRLNRGGRAVEVFWHREKSAFWTSYGVGKRSLRRVRATDLMVAIDSAATWLSGATPREFAAAWPFADFVAIADAYERGDRIEYSWQSALVHDPFGLTGFIAAAMNEPRLRTMYPFVQMGWMSFRPTVDEFLVPGPWVSGSRQDDGVFKVCSVDRDRWHGEPLAVGDAETAVRVVVAEMDRLGVPRPEDLRSPSEHRPPAEAGG
ncbi:DUF6193 family natural product biosynthesis protein [Kutzneria sp. 744]|uniref:DUF6193 family natural product biosynthesis protein n=1 Tax=Kutzneria sp. (strain 744) TaxID=345341 RepID=UPI0003EECD96|nr:DUF6193 family natural product biosynthesis protein [Kutzneria sp. 744]EWM12269.1 hypothetical protein KUTG_02573 [Kutzneria sp. 744]